MSGNATAPGAQRMRQLFAPGADAILRFAALVLVVGMLGAAAGVFAWARGDFAGNVGVAPEQPVPFSHKHHSGELGIDCRMCHQQVEVLASAGLPPTHTCMTCHSVVWNQSPMLQPVRESLANGTPMHWVRVNRLPDYVYFNHSIHIAKQIGCSSCHGPVDTMQLTYRAQAFRMEFCLNCHRNPEKYVRAEDQIWNMEWGPPPDQAVVGPQLVKDLHIAGPQELSDCSVCHR